MPLSPISRRTLLKRAGAALPLPLLEIMSPAITSAAAAQPAVPPVRYLWVFQSCGFYPGAWNPTGEGTDFELPRTLKPCADFKDRLTVVRNLRTQAYGNHVGKVTAMLTGIQAERDPQTGVFTSAKSVDQILADKICEDTPLKSLQLGIEHPGQGYCSGANTPVSYGATLSWSSPTAMLLPELAPRKTFDSLFRNRDGAEGNNQSRWQRSVLDLVGEEAKTIRRRGSAQDRRKIDEYLESVRDVERRIDRTLNPPQRSWTPPTKPDATHMSAPPPGIPADRTEHVRMMLDLMTLAVWTDSTRVASLILANTLSEANFSFIDGVTEPFHSGLSHHGNKPKKVEQYCRVNEWHATQLAYLLSRLDSIDEQDGTALDNSVVFFGSSLKDGDAHSNIDLPIACFGRAGGRLKPAGHVICPENTHISNLHLTTLRWFGAEQSDFNGQSAKVISELV